MEIKLDESSPGKLTPDEVMKQLRKKIDEAVAAAEAHADAHGLVFSLDIAYGMGGTYIGKGIEHWGEEGWNPSSQSC